MKSLTKYLMLFLLTFSLASCKDNNIKSDDIPKPTTAEITTMLATAQKPARDSVVGFDTVPYANYLNPMGETIVDNIIVADGQQRLNDAYDLFNGDKISFVMYTYVSNDDGSYYMDCKYDIEIDRILDYYSMYSDTPNSVYRTLRKGLYCWIEDTQKKVYCKCSQAHYVGAEDTLKSINECLSCEILSSNIVKFENSEYSRIIVKRPVECFGVSNDEEYDNIYLYFDNNQDIKYIVFVYPDYVYSMSFENISTVIKEPDDKISKDYTEIEYDELSKSIHLIREIH